MSKHITIGFDGSPEAREALRWGAGEAAARSCELQIMACYRLPATAEMYGGWVPAEAYGASEQAAGDQLMQARDAIAEEFPQLTIATSLRAGQAASLLSEEPAGDQQMIVVGASSHRGASAFWLGSTSRALVRHAHCPVVIVRGAPGRHQPDRVVVGVDGSEASTQAVRWAAAEADLHGVELCVVHVWEYPYLTVTTGESQARDLTEIDAACVLEESLTIARDVCGSDVTGSLVEDAPASGLMRSVRDGDLLVLGSRGRGAVRAGMFGSTVNSVLDRAAIPVVVLRDAQIR